VTAFDSQRHPALAQLGTAQPVARGEEGM